jgi:MFS family permease
MNETLADLGRSVGLLAGRALGGTDRARMVVVLACVLGLSAADTATVGASARELRAALGIDNTDVGLLVSATSLVAAMGALPFGALADRVRRTRTLGVVVLFWGGAMLWCAAAGSFTELLAARLALGLVTAAAGPLVASLVGDAFPAAVRGRMYGFILMGELVGAGLGFTVTGDIATLSWRAAFIALAVPAVPLTWAIFRLPEPERGRSSSIGEHSGDEGQGPTDAQRLARRSGIHADRGRVSDADLSRISLLAAAKYVLKVRTNLTLIAASACGYYFLAGVQTFGLEFTERHYRIGQGLANVVLLVVGVGAVAGVLAGGHLGDWLVRRGYLPGRIVVSAVAAAAATALFAEALFTRRITSALPYLIGATFALSAQNPPLDAARLDIMPARLWGRAEAIRGLLRGLAQALAPLLFGAVSDHVFGGGGEGLRWTFTVMLVPLAASAGLLFHARLSYPQDVANAAPDAAAPAPRALRT